MTKLQTMIFTMLLDSLAEGDIDTAAQCADRLDGAELPIDPEAADRLDGIADGYAAIVNPLRRVARKMRPVETA